MEEEEQKESSKGTKRKLKMEEYEQVLSKRHAAYIPFRDETINRYVHSVYSSVISNKLNYDQGLIIVHSTNSDRIQFNK